MKTERTSDHHQMFKVCSTCGAYWRSRDQFLEDPSLSILGYQVNFDKLTLGLFLFNHETCRSTISLSADQFIDLYDGPVYQQRKTSTDECPEYCLREGELDPCAEQCECASIREILHIIRNRKHVS